MDRERLTGGADGGTPTGELVGSLFGTTRAGGANGMGTVFEIKKGKQSVLYSFCKLKACADGANSEAGMVRDTLGNLYGVTTGGGEFGHGAVFEVTKTGVETVLHSFTGGADGADPTGNLIMDAKGNLYGTARDGGKSGCGGTACGVVFELTP